MKISSVRLGHANNSSSMHSILLNSPSPQDLNPAEDFQYGWGWFHLKDAGEKAKYLTALIYSSLSMEMAKEHAAIIAGALTGCPLPPAEDRWGPDAYVDHQSVFTFPHKFVRYGHPELHHDFLKEFVAYVRDNPNVSIRGGNDNSEDPGTVSGEPAPVNDLPQEHRWGHLIARKDGGWWALFNKQTGAKLRLSFLDNPAPYLGATRPELVDIKITDYCPYACDFCYQGATPTGKHAALDDLRALARELGDAEVFEVALGGGEPTLHPAFPQVLQLFHESGCKPNFATYSLAAWRGKPVITAAVQKYAGSFAVSCLTEVGGIADWNKHNTPQATLQVPLGCYPRATVEAALNAACAMDVPVTLLGYKATGRGAAFTPEAYAWVVDLLLNKDHGYRRFGADAVFVSQFGAQLEAGGISPKLMVTGEGAFTCYIDAVTGQAGASSYCGALHPLDKCDPFSRFPYVPDVAPAAKAAATTKTCPTCGAAQKG